MNKLFEDIKNDESIRSVFVINDLYKLNNDTKNVNA